MRCFFCAVVEMISRDITSQEGQCECIGKRTKQKKFLLTYLDYDALKNGSFPNARWVPSNANSLMAFMNLETIENKHLSLTIYYSNYGSQSQVTLVSMFHSNFGGQIRISSAWEIFWRLPSWTFILFQWNFHNLFGIISMHNFGSQIRIPSFIVKTITYGPNEGNCILGLQSSVSSLTMPILPWTYMYILDDVFEDQIFELPRSHQDDAKAPHLCSTIGAEQTSEA